MEPCIMNYYTILITAGRTITDPDPMWRVFTPLVEEIGAGNIIFRHGGAIGGDQYGAFVMRQLGVKIIQARPVPQEAWAKYGKSAGNIRNEEMLDEEPIPNLVLAFPDDNSKGTYNCFDQALKRKIPAKIYFDYLSLDNPKRTKYYFYEGVT